MKDQKRIVHQALVNAEPVLALRGRDVCALPVLYLYYYECMEKGCNTEFLKDLKECIAEFKAYSENEGKVLMRIPD